MSPCSNIPTRPLCDTTIWAQYHRHWIGERSHWSEYPHNTGILWWRGVENHNLDCGAPGQPISVHRPICSQLWFHWKLQWHQEIWCRVCCPSHERLQLSSTQLQRHFLWASLSIWPVLFLHQGASDRCPLVHPPPLATYIAATFVYPIPICQKLLSDVPKYWLEDDDTMSLDNDHRWRSTKTLQYGTFLLDFNVRFLQCPVDQVENDTPMSRRPGKHAPAKARGPLCHGGATVNLTCS